MLCTYVVNSLNFSVMKETCIAYFSYYIYLVPLNVRSLTNDVYYMKQVSFVDALRVILYDEDLDEPDSNSLSPLFSL